LSRQSGSAENESDSGQRRNTILTAEPEQHGDRLRPGLAELRWLARKDALTGLPHRHCCRDSLAQALIRLAGCGGKAGGLRWLGWTPICRAMPV